LNMSCHTYTTCSSLFEVPTTTRIKVPVHHTTVVPTTKYKTIKSTKYVTVPTVSTVKQHYTTTEYRPKTRWVKKTYGDCCSGYVTTCKPEEYLQKVRVHKTKRVHVPSTKIKAVSDYKVVPVTTNKLVSYKTYRTEKIHGSKFVDMDCVPSSCYSSTCVPSVSTSYLSDDEYSISSDSDCMCGC